MKRRPLEYRKKPGGWKRRAGAFLAAFALFFGLAGSLPTVRPRPDAFFTFDVDVLWFPDSARAQLSFRRTGSGRYRAELVAETKGMLRLVSLFQQNYYVSEMEFDPAAGRLLPLRFTKTITRIGISTRTSITVDRLGKKLHWRIEGNRMPVEKGVAPIPEGILYEDLLTAFFNFREGAYGSVKRGEKISIRLLPLFEPTPINANEGEFQFFQEKTEMERTIEARIIPEALEQRYRWKYGKIREKGYLVIVKVPKDIFGQETGEIRVWFDAALIPTEATVENAIFFGDVTGRLRRAFIGGSLKEGRGRIPAN